MQVGQLKKCVLRVLEIVFAKRDMVEKDVMNVWLVGLDIQIVNHVSVHQMDPHPLMEFVMLLLDSVLAKETLEADNVKLAHLETMIIPTATVSIKTILILKRVPANTYPRFIGNY